MTQDDLRFLLKDKYGLHELGENPSAEILEDIKLLEQGMPRDYVIGFTEFLGSRIDLSLKPLIPRIETEHWVGKLIEEYKDVNSYKVLDIFCGSGCIGISLLKHFGNWEITFADISNDALKQTQINLDNNNIGDDRYKVIKSDIFEGVEGHFDLIVANPPYIGLREEVGDSTKFEPNEALYSGDDGLDVIRRFIRDAKSHLNPGGHLWMEFGSGQKEKIRELLEENEIGKFEFFNDQFDRPRWVVVSGV